MNQSQQVANPFQAPTIAVNNAVAHSDAERATQEVQAAMIIAKKFPRDTVKAMDKILNTCTRPTLANTALYCYPRGGVDVTGPSIRLAEALAQEWGNIQFGIRELSSENGVSSVEAFAWDIESNTRQIKTFQVPHLRYTRNGSKKLTDPRDIYEMVANQGARRMRACILGVIPGDVTEAAVNQCAITQKNAVEVNADTIKSMISAFEENYGVSQELIEKKVGKRAQAINAQQLLSLKRIYQSLKDGMSKPSAWFDIPEADASQSSVSSISLTSKNKPQDVPEPEEEQEKVPSADGIFGQQ